MDEPEPSVTEWLERLKSGEPGAVEPLWNHYFPRLVRLADRKLRGLRHACEDAEDVALGAFDSFVRGAERGKFPDLGDRDDLWNLLSTITKNRAKDQWRQRYTKKAGGARLQGESALGDPAAGFDQLGDDALTPELVATWTEEVQLKLALLRDPPWLERVALLMLEGYDLGEIAVRIGRSMSSVHRYVAEIRQRWREYDGGGRP
jgi:DNA-directed RNA polymerase specialized sigma24 family protein